MNYRIGPSRKRPQREKIVTNGYQWPASRLDSDDMHLLHRLRMETNKPITVLIQEAVRMYYETCAFKVALSTADSPPVDLCQSRPESSPESAPVQPDPSPEPPESASE